MTLDIDGMVDKVIKPGKLDLFLRKERKKNKYDPRRDLMKDHKYWVAVLEVAEAINKQIYGNLHGMRCAGCELVIDDKGHLKLKPPIGANQFWRTEKDWQNDRQEWLIPYQKQIISIFKRAESKLNIQEHKKTG